MSRYFDTSYGDAYEKRFKSLGTQIMDSKTFHSNNIFSGNQTGIKKPEKIMITTKVISEKYNGKLW